MDSYREETIVRFQGIPAFLLGEKILSFTLTPTGEIQ